MGLINFLIVKMLVKTKFANIINIASNEEIIPELLQSKCNSKEIFKKVSNYLDNPKKIIEQVKKTQKILEKFKTKDSASIQASKEISRFL